MDFKLQFYIEISYLGVRTINSALKSKLKFWVKMSFLTKKRNSFGNLSIFQI